MGRGSQAGAQGPGGRPKGRARDRGAEHPNQRLSVNVAGSTPWKHRVQGSQRVSGRRRTKDRGARIWALCSPRRAALEPGARVARRRPPLSGRGPEDKAGAVPRVLVPGTVIPGPREVPSPVPKRDTPPPVPSNCKNTERGKEMFLTGTAQLFLCCYPGKEKMGKVRRAAGSQEQRGGHGGEMTAPGQRRAPQAPAAAAHEPEPAAPSRLSADVPWKLGETCWK